MEQLNCFGILQGRDRGLRADVRMYTHKSNEVLNELESSVKLRAISGIIRPWIRTDEIILICFGGV